MDRHDPFGRSKLPPAFDRKHRVRLLHEAALAWSTGREPSPEARAFVAGGLLAWLESPVGSDLLKDHWQTVGPQGSNVTPQSIVREALLEELLEQRQNGGASPKCGNHTFPEAK